MNTSNLIAQMDKLQAEYDAAPKSKKTAIHNKMWDLDRQVVDANRSENPESTAWTTALVKADRIDERAKLLGQRLDFLGTGKHFPL